MKRRLAATALILMLPLGMAACGSTQSTADACKEIATARDAVLKESESVDISSMDSQQEYAVDWVDPQAAMPSESMRIRAVAARRRFMESPGCVGGVQRHANACKKYVGSRV